jgi:uridine kinase
MDGSHSENVAAMDTAMSLSQEAVRLYREKMEVYEEQFQMDTKAGHEEMKAVQEKMEDVIMSSQEENKAAINSILSELENFIKNRKTS